jgi:hypothetical protein
MAGLINEKKLIEIFISCDDFDKSYEHWLSHHALGEKPLPTRRPSLSDSEILTLLIFYHWSGYKNFEYYYQNYALIVLKKYFPTMPSYSRFVELIPRQAMKMYMFLKVQTLLSQRTGTYFIDSKKLPVCHNKRIHNNKVFTDFAARGKSSTGWYYGLKIHLIINQLGEIVNFELTSANVSDNNEHLLKKMLDGLHGTCYGDKGYLSKLFAYFYQKGLKIVTKIRSNMKNILVPIKEKINLKKRALIESVNDILMTVFDLEHTRHRSPINAITHTFGALAAYGFYENKPSVFIKI